ncbi:hypothetical protein KIW84_023374 [Lathyrus oleraceus]|uniref:RNA-directed DNA polymerase, eukaryota, reverse transcriptase zinc-binding domain protein n=1 Tax=Pisum sativum TaxID=3888 RepID=A0A9D4YFC5_PEA|nr:hypothetical protein KIW84_023374 [Pisum sativum]
MSTLVNGSVLKNFIMERGFRQWDSLSPFLFVMAMEGITGLMNMVVDIGEFTGFHINEEVSVDILQFADNTIIIGDGRPKNLWSMKAISRASVKVLKKIIWVEANFLWEGSDFKRIIHWVNWDSVCKPKEDGDLGIKKIEIFNKALLLKWKWRILKENDTLWSGILRNRYHDPKLKMIIKEGRTVEEGGGISFWNSKWLGKQTLKEAFPEAF